MTLRYAHLIPGTGDNVRAVLDGLSKATSSPGAEQRVDNSLTTEPVLPEENGELPNHSKQIE
jgi:hypothetical protein